MARTLALDPLFAEMLTEGRSKPLAGSRRAPRRLLFSGGEPGMGSGLRWRPASRVQGLTRRGRRPVARPFASKLGGGKGGLLCRLS